MNMTKTIPLFPLNIVAFPQEQVNLHIFEPRYKALVRDCMNGNKRFGIPAYVHNKVEYGTEMSIQEVIKTYDDGRLDITTRGQQIFHVDLFEPGASIEDYAVGNVHYPENDRNAPQELWVHFIEKVNEFFDALMIQNNISLLSDTISYDVAHKVGLSLEQEYEFLQLFSEEKRQTYIIEHLIKTIPILKEVERSKLQIQMNGHFKHFDPLQF